jgi:putative phage-type endonuclease
MQTVTFSQTNPSTQTTPSKSSQWLQARQQGIGASDAATAVGLNPYKSQLELWMEKTGRIIPQQPDPNEDSPMVWGTKLEPIVAEHYAKRTQSKVRRVNAILQHSEYPCYKFIALSVMTI